MRSQIISIWVSWSSIQKIDLKKVLIYLLDTESLAQAFQCTVTSCKIYSFFICFVNGAWSFDKKIPIPNHTIISQKVHLKVELIFLVWPKVHFVFVIIKIFLGNIRNYEYLGTSEDNMWQFMSLFWVSYFNDSSVDCVTFKKALK